MTTNLQKPTKRTDKVIDQPLSIWLPDAEKSPYPVNKFKESYFSIDIAEKYLGRYSIKRVLSSVKGIGKTYILQIKRLMETRHSICLPYTIKGPSEKSDWGTESMEFEKYHYKYLHDKDFLISLWKYSIACYFINHCLCSMHDEKYKELKDSLGINITDKLQYKFRLEGMNTITLELCTEFLPIKLSAIISRVLESDNRKKIVNTDYLLLAPIIDDILHIIYNRKDISKKNYSIFIDKIDQSIDEPSLDLIKCAYKNCKKQGFAQCQINECAAKFSYMEVGFASKLDDTLYWNAYKKIWQNVQISLFRAVNSFENRFKSRIKIYFTIREESLISIGQNFGKEKSIIQNLSYTKEDQKQIFYNYIKHQHDKFLLYPAKKTGSDKEKETAFAGVTEVCHPYVKDENGKNIPESLFDILYRHSFDRTRDLQRYAAEITNFIGDGDAEKMEIFRRDENKAEKIKKIVEGLAARLLYEKGQDKEDTYYREKNAFMPNYWRNKDNFEKLLKQIYEIKRNVLFYKDITDICVQTNKCKKCDEIHCDKVGCPHPFSFLQELGLLGYVTKNGNAESATLPQIFKNSNDITHIENKNYITFGENTIYLLHPTLTKAIEQNFGRIYHFSKFIISKDSEIKTNDLIQILEDKKKLDQGLITKESFINNYFGIIPAGKVINENLPTIQHSTELKTMEATTFGSPQLLMMEEEKKYAIQETSTKTGVRRRTTTTQTKTTDIVSTTIEEDDPVEEKRREIVVEKKTRYITQKEINTALDAALEGTTNPADRLKKLKEYLLIYEKDENKVITFAHAIFLRHRVCHIVESNAEGKIASLGTGYLIKRNKKFYVLTARHLISECVGNIEIKPFDDENEDMIYKRNFDRKVKNLRAIFHDADNQMESYEIKFDSGFYGVENDYAILSVSTIYDDSERNYLKLLDEFGNIEDALDSDILSQLEIQKISKDIINKNNIYYVTSIHHQNGEPRTYSIPDKITSIQEDKHKILYEINTDHGTSGAPIFFGTGKIIAVHNEWSISESHKLKYTVNGGYLITPNIFDKCK